MILAGDLNGDSTAGLAGQLTPASQASVGPLKGLDCQHGAFFHENRLTDLEARNLLADTKPEVDVLLLFSGQLGAETEAGSRHKRLKPGSGLNEFDAILFQFIGNRAEDSVRIFFFQTHQHSHGPKIGTDVIEILGRDLAE